jgi:hypothetical protein
VFQTKMLEAIKTYSLRLINVVCDNLEKCGTARQAKDYSTITVQKRCHLHDR